MTNYNNLIFNGKYNSLIYYLKKNVYIYSYYSVYNFIFNLILFYFKNNIIITMNIIFKKKKKTVYFSLNFINKIFNF